MSKEELFKKFEKNVQYLKNNIPPDDIYAFAEQTFMAALYFMHRWSTWEDLNEIAKEDPIAKKWIVNILSLQMMKDRNEAVELDLGLDEMEES